MRQFFNLVALVVVATGLAGLTAHQARATGPTRPALAPLKKSPQPTYQTLFATPGVGFFSTTYTETGKPDYSMLSLTGKLVIRYVFQPSWDMSVSGNMTLLPITRSAETDVRFLGINLRVGYVIPSIPNRWRFTIMTGLYYTTMLVSTQTFGFQNMSGPQIFPVVQRTFDSGTLMGHFKFSPVAKKISLLAMENHEFAIGGAWAWLLRNGHPLSVALELSMLNLTIEEIETNTSSFGIGLGYGF